LATYSYDARGRRTRVQYGNGARNDIAFDAQSRLDSLFLNLNGTANDNSTSFDYNPAGQITELTKSNPGYGWTGLDFGQTSRVWRRQRLKKFMTNSNLDIYSKKQIDNISYNSNIMLRHFMI
jgi:hypothetical protein